MCHLLVTSLIMHFTLKKNSLRKTIRNVTFFVNSHGNCAASYHECVLQVASILFTENMVTSRATSSQED